LKLRFTPGGLCWVWVRFDFAGGSFNALCLVDSGCKKSMVREGLVPELDLASGNREMVDGISGKKTVNAVGPAHLSVISAASTSKTIELSRVHGNSALAGIDGLLGIDALTLLEAKIDFAAGTLDLAD